MRAAAVYHRRAPGRNRLERAEEVDEILLLRLRQRVEPVDDRVGLGRLELRVPRALAGADGHDQIARTPVAQEEEPLAATPERRGPELLAERLALCARVGQLLSHAAQGPVG